MKHFVRMMMMLLVVGALVASTGCSTMKKKTPATVPTAIDTPATQDPQAPPSVEPQRELGEPVEFPAEAGIKPIFFDFDKSTIRPDQIAVLDKNLNYFMNNQGFKVVVEGHCDERGTVEYNFALGNKRADAVKAYMVQKGLPAERVVTVSKGEEQPADPGKGEKAFAKNRRAYFKQIIIK